MVTFKQWLNEVSTIQQLDMKARSAFPQTKKRHNDVGSVNVMNGDIFTPNTERGELTIDSRTSSSRSGSAHTQRIMLYSVTYTQLGQNGSTSLPNTEVAIEPAKLTSNTARVACDCMDFRFRFANMNNKDDSLAGDAPPEYHKVPGSTRGPINPKQLPGMCKHLYAVVQRLKQQRIII